MSIRSLVKRRQLIRKVFSLKTLLSWKVLIKILNFALKKLIGIK
uniref:Uncharacterized protein n=1 Tax=Myoviridae sp. ctYA416 TaxID=2825125 RepID=A0A8S5UTS9_9CAUD|nr:MAG TPA: hypothetical protein [Myoviridae sp. ctYA416]